MTKVSDIVNFIHLKASPTLAMPWDNIGLLVGDGSAPVERALICLDITPTAIETAVANGCTLLISHHPVIFNALKTLPTGSVPYLLAQHGLSALCAHTNLDAAYGGVNDTLAELLGLCPIGVAADGTTRLAETREPMTAQAFAAMTAERLHTAVRVSAADRPIRRVAICTGAGGDLTLEAAAQDAAVDTILTGELKHHEWLEAAARGLTALEAGHYATEVPVIYTLYKWLTDAFPKVTFRTFEQPPYRTIDK